MNSRLRCGEVLLVMGQHMQRHGGGTVSGAQEGTMASWKNLGLWQ